MASLPEQPSVLPEPPSALPEQPSTSLWLLSLNIKRYFNFFNSISSVTDIVSLEVWKKIPIFASFT